MLLKLISSLEDNTLYTIIVVAVPFSGLLTAKCEKYYLVSTCFLIFQTIVGKIFDDIIIFFCDSFII